MNKMRLIDLFNRVVNNEELPKSFKYISSTGGEITFENLENSAYYESNEEYEKHGLDEPFTLPEYVLCDLSNLDEEIYDIEWWDKNE